MYERIKHRDFPLVANDQSSEIGNPCNRSLDFPATFVSPQLATVLAFRFRTVCTMGANQLDATLLQSISQGIRIGRLVVDQPCGILSRTATTFPRHRDLFQGRLNERDFIRCRRGKLYSQRNTLAVCHHHKLRTLSAFGFADACAPFFADENVPSAKVSSQCRRRFSSKWPRKVRQIFSQIPCSSQSRSLRQQVLAEGNLLGKSFHRAPLRNTQRMPSKHGRLGIGVRPPLGENVGSGSSAAILAHCLSVNSAVVAMEKSPP